MGFTANLTGVPEGFIAGRAQSHLVADNNMYFIGCVPPGHRARLTLIKAASPAVDVDVIVDCNVRANSSESEIGIVVNTADDPIELYDPNGGGFPVRVGKRVSGSDNFTAKLCIIDHPGTSLIKDYPYTVDGGYAEAFFGPGSEVDNAEFDAPSGIAEGDLLFVAVGVDESGIDFTVANAIEAYYDASWHDEGEGTIRDWTRIGTLGTRIPEIQLFAKVATAADESVEKWRWHDDGNNHEWGIGMLVIRRQDSGAETTLEDYGIGAMGGTWGPPIWNGTSAAAKTDTTEEMDFLCGMKGQKASCNVEVQEVKSQLPFAVLTIFAAGEDTGVPDYPVYGVFQVYSAADPNIKKCTYAECKVVNKMLSMALLPLAYDGIQVTGAALLDGETAFNFQAAYLYLGFFS